MSEDGVEPLLTDRDDDNDAHSEAPLIDMSIDETSQTGHLADLRQDPLASPDLHQRHPSASDNSGNPRSHPPGSSETSATSLNKGQTLDEDIEAQAAADRKARRLGCCQTYLGQINFAKWYDWIAYYIPILEWLPKYQCTPPCPADTVRYIARDIFAGLTLASISIPMSLSYAAYTSHATDVEI
jgi:hypothetical protein